VVELLRVDGKLVIAPLEPAQELAAAPNLDRN
jgi:hypothetical protein